MYIEIFIDAAARNNGLVDRPTEAACAAIIYDRKKEIARYCRLLGSRSNNQAEYEALILALTMASSMKLENVKIYSDSLVVVNQINSIWRCNSNELLPFYLSVKIIEREFPFQLIHVPRNIVWYPDKLCNKALDYLRDFKSLPSQYDEVLVMRSLDNL